jgi:uncharacterized NAD(P)/FAD-binding protein YdhS
LTKVAVEESPTKIVGFTDCSTIRVVTDTPRSTRSRIVIVGGGAAGVLVAAHLRRRRPDARITVVDDSGRPGTGAAYGTPDPTHLLNVPAERMSAWPDDPEDLCRWLDRHAVATFEGFAPRVAFGRYLGDVLAAADVWLEPAEVVGLVSGTPHRVALADGRVLAADAVALATGRPPGTMPDALARALAPVLGGGGSCAVVEDPWAPGALVGLVARKPERVAVIGSGLTGIDVALHLLARGSEVTLVSRHGELPRRHRKSGPPAELVAIGALGDDITLDELRAALGHDLATTRASGGDWRQVIDGLRPHTARLWQAMGWADQRRFLREDLRAWEVVRHRMPPTVADAVDDALMSGRLSVVAAEVAEALPADGGVALTLATADGTLRRRDDALVVATGTAWDRRALGSSALWASLLAQGRATLHSSGIGVRTNPAGRLVDQSGDVTPGVVCLGAIRQGELWESTAIPEIRQQAAAVAELLAATSPVVEQPSARHRPPGRQSPADAAYAEGRRRLLTVQQGASQAFAAAVTADPGHARAHVALALIATERPDRAGGPSAVAEHVRRARAAATAASDADKSHVEAMATWCEQGSRAGTAALVAHLDQVPDDDLALVVLAPSIAFAGAGDALPDVWSYVDEFASVHGEAPWYLGLLAYGRTEQVRFHDAADLAEAALDADPSNGNGAHALTHVHYETDAHSAGLRWLSDWVDASGRTQRYRPHFQWHAALHELAMGDAAAAARRYAAHLAPPRSTGVRCLVDAGSLTWRARLHPDWVTPPDPLAVLAEAGDLATAPPTAFIALHALLLHAANHDVAAVRSIAVPSLTDAQDATLTSVAEGLVALLEERPRDALDHLVEALPGLPELGGSRVQQEVVLETALAAMLRLGAPGQAARLLSRHRSGPAAGIARGAVS